jgi:hypothetical protein
MAQRAHAWNLLVFLATTPLLWVAARLWGLPGLAWTMLALCGVMFVLAWRFLIWPACGANFVRYSSPLIPPLGVTVLATTITFAVVQPSLPAFWHLPVGVVAFGLSYLVLSWYINRPWATAMVELLKPLIRIFR